MVGYGRLAIDTSTEGSIVDNAGIPVQVNVVMMSGLDGNDSWPALDIATVACRYVIRFSPEAAEQLAEFLPSRLREVADECKRIASGLVTAHTIPEGEK